MVNKWWCVIILDLNLSSNFQDLALNLVDQYFVYSRIWVNGILIDKMGELEELDSKKPWDDVKRKKIISVPTKYGMWLQGH